MKKEIILSDGTFCEVRRPIYLDVVACRTAVVGNLEMFTCAYVSKLCLFDGEPRTMEEVLHMDAMDVDLICKALEQFKTEAVKK